LDFEFARRTGSSAAAKVAGEQAAERLHEGRLAAGIAHRFTFDAARLSSGLYLYRAAGKSFTMILALEPAYGKEKAD